MHLCARSSGIVVIVIVIVVVAISVNIIIHVVTHVVVVNDAIVVSIEVLLETNV